MRTIAGALLLAALAASCRPDPPDGDRPPGGGFDGISPETLIALGDDATEDAADWAEGTHAAADGATREYYNRAAKLEWKHRLGDYRDAGGDEQGKRPFASAAVDAAGVPGWVEFDVTALVDAWARAKFPHRGFYLKVKGAGDVKFRSREHAAAGERPQLALEAAGGPATKAPVADTYLDGSTYKCFGDDDLLRVSSAQPALLRFDLDGVESVSKATLRLYAEWRSGGGSIEVEVYRCAQGEGGAEDRVREGLAAAYPGDRGIAKHADVVLFSDFEGSDWGRDWTDGADRETLRRVDAEPKLGFVPLQGKALRVVIERGAVTGLNMDFKFAKEIGKEPEEMYFRYYLRISSEWHSTQGGKLPGFSGTYDRSGWGGRKVDGTDGWSARGLHLPMPNDAANPLRRHVPIGNYVYHVDMEGFYGTHFLWTKGRRGYLEPNRWYCIEQQVKLNDPKKADGILRAWVDGRLAFEKTDLRFRLTDKLKIEKLWMNVYHGGTQPVAADSVLYIDNVVIARGYIGPIGKPAR